MFLITFFNNVPFTLFFKYQNMQMSRVLCKINLQVPNVKFKDSQPPILITTSVVQVTCVHTVLAT